MFLILRKSCLIKNISNRTLNFISKSAEYVSLIDFKLQGTIMSLRNKLMFNFLFEFLDDARGWYTLYKS